MSLLSLIFLFITCSAPVGPIEEKSFDAQPLIPTESGNITMHPLTMRECGYNIGDVACGIYARDQSGSWQRLHDYEGKVILLEFATLWCNFCMTAAFYHEDITKKFSKKKFQWVTVMLENWKGEKPYYEELHEFGIMYGMEEYPIWAGDRSLIIDERENKVKWPVGAVPTFFVINKNFKITAIIQGWNTELIIKELKRARK